MQVRKMKLQSDNSHVEYVMSATFHVKITEVGRGKEDSGFITAANLKR
jgi:hypothetical protein